LEYNSIVETDPGRGAARRPAAKSDRIQLRVSSERRARYEAAAAIEGKTLTEFVASAADAATENTLADRRIFPLDDEAWERFNEMLDAPPKVLPGLVELFVRPDVFGDNE
jgi:uncharacterized protein (DUF1778 family)